MGFRGAGIWPLNREASKSSMLPSHGFEEGLAGQGRRGVTGAGGGGKGEVICSISHSQVGNGTVIDQADQS